MCVTERIFIFQKITEARKENLKTELFKQSDTLKNGCNMTRLQKIPPRETVPLLHTVIKMYDVRTCIGQPMNLCSVTPSV
jgi:hypothetical protein